MTTYYVTEVISDWIDSEVLELKGSVRVRSSIAASSLMI